MNTPDTTALLEYTTTIVSAYVSNNTIPRENLVTLIADTFRSLAQVERAEPAVEDLKPAVAIKRSVQPDHIVCLDDGKKFKSLKRHLMTHYNLTPQAYREKWGLPADYPMVAPNYALARSELAKKIGLGQQRKSAILVEPVKAMVKPSTKIARTSKRATKKAVAA